MIQVLALTFMRLNNVFSAMQQIYEEIKKLIAYLCSSWNTEIGHFGNWVLYEISHWCSTRIPERNDGTVCAPRDEKECVLSHGAVNDYSAVQPGIAGED